MVDLETTMKLVILAGKGAKSLSWTGTAAYNILR